MVIRIDVVDYVTKKLQDEALKKIHELEACNLKPRMVLMSQELYDLVRKSKEAPFFVNPNKPYRFDRLYGLEVQVSELASGYAFEVLGAK